MKKGVSAVVAVALLASLTASAAAKEKVSRDTSPGSIAGPEGVAQELEKVGKRESIRPVVSPLRSYFNWKERIKRDHGISFGLSSHLLYQAASESLGEDDDAFGGVYRFQGSWVAIGRGTRHPGRLEWRVEGRSEIGDLLSPSQLGGEVGAAALNTGFGYSHNFSADPSVLNWTQTFNDKRCGFAVGRLAFDVYLDSFMFQTFSKGFLNRSFIVNPTIGTTGIGALGAVAKGFLTDNILIGGQIYDGNAASGEFDFDTFEEHEWLTAAEIAWTPSRERFGTDRVQFTWWHKDEREKAGVTSGSGWAVSASWKVNDRLIPFTRFGHSDGGAGVAAESAVSLGFEFKPKKNQTLGVGAGWAKPVQKGEGEEPRHEYVVETSWTFQITPNFSVTPDLQLLIDPAHNPAKDSVWVGGLRVILTL